MTVADFLGCPLRCGREIPHDCEAERSLIALCLLSELYARRILPRLQTPDFMDPTMRGVFAQLRVKWSVYPPALGSVDVWQAEADPQSIDKYVEAVKARLLQRNQQKVLHDAFETAQRRPLTPAEMMRLMNKREAATDVTILEVA